MALINKIREKTGLAVGVIAFGLILFLVGGDILGPNSVLLGNNDTSVGTIAGEKVDFKDFSSRVDMVTQGRGVNSDQLPFVREQIWTDLVREISYGKKINLLGIGLPSNEEEEIITGNNISPLIQQNFTNPQTGQFNKEDVIRFLQNYGTFPAQQKLAWDQLQQQVGSFRQIQKYQNLVLKTNYVTKAEAKQDFMAKGASASVSFVYVPFLSISDSVASATDSELNAYISANSDEYQVEASRDIAYVEFNIAPSATDTAERKRDIDELIVALKDSDKDSLFAIRNSEALTPFRTVKKDDMPQELKDIEDLPIGEVYGPYLKGSKYVAYKVSALSDKYSARASNIVIQPEDQTDEAKAAARTKAAGILREIRNGADFAEKAAEYNTDRTAQTGGDLGWFTEGQMVPAFNDAVMGATKKGLITRLVESSYGFHIIDVTETKVLNSYKLVQLEIDIYASDETINQYYRQSESFAAASIDYESFKKNAEEQGLTILEKKRMGQNESRVNSLSKARDLVAWAFRDTEIGDVSDVKDYDGKYVVAVLTGVQEKGTAKLSTVRNEVERKVINEKKAEYIKGKLNASGATLEDIASAYGTEAKVYSQSGLTLSTNALNNVGAAPEAIGLIFAMNEGEKTAPLTADNGVVIVQLDSKTEATPVDDYTYNRDQLAQSRQVRLTTQLDNTVKEFADIEDRRYKFF